MNFFKSVFSDDPDPPGSDSDSHNAHRTESQHSPGSDFSPTEHRSDLAGAGGWDFGGLMKSLSLKSESIMETYRRDLQEFGIGLKKEMEIAHGSVDTFGHTIDQFGYTVIKGTAQMISQGKEAILEFDDSYNNKNGSNNKSLNSKRYSRFDAQVRAIQGDPSTYTQEPEDLERYNKWKSEFSLEGKSDEMEGFLRENDAMDSVYKRVVPDTVDRDTFWYRYYYRVYKLKIAEDVRARLVRRMSKEEEELSWDVEDDEEEECVDEDQGRMGDSEVKDGGFDVNWVVGTKRFNVEEVGNAGGEESMVEKRDNLLESKELGDKMDQSIGESKIAKNSQVVEKMGDGSKEAMDQVGDTGNRNDVAAGSDEKVMMERKEGDGKSPLVASQHSEHEEELEWDEIEDLSNIDEKKETRSGRPSKVDLRKRLSAAEEEEDLTWDIEEDDDDDEPAKA